MKIYTANQLEKNRAVLKRNREMLTRIEAFNRVAKALEGFQKNHKLQALRAHLILIA